MSKTEELVQALSELTVLEMAELKDALEDKWGVTAAAPMMAAAMPAGDGGESADAGPESTEFDVVLAEFPAPKKISIIKVVRELTGLGLKEAKELVESVPATLKEAASKTEADEIVKKIEDAGGKTTLKGL